MSPPSIRAGTVNVNTLINKIRLIVNLLDVERLDLLAICETCLTSVVPTSFVHISGYNFFRKDVAGATRKHGVGLCIRKNNQPMMIDVSVANTLVVHVLEWDTFIIVSYRPPSYNDLKNYSLRTFLSEFCIDQNVLMLGDFNLPSIKWDETRSDSVLPSRATSFDRSFYEIFLEVGLTQLVFEHTLITSNTILDLILVSNTEIVGVVAILPPLPKCQHCPVVVELHIEVNDNSNIFNVRLWSKGNFAAINE